MHPAINPPQTIGNIARDSPGVDASRVAVIKGRLFQSGSTAIVLPHGIGVAHIL
jgi:hypothetical protein